MKHKFFTIRKSAISILVLCMLMFQPLSLLSVNPGSSDWNQYRGGNRNGTVEMPDHFSKWPVDGPVLLWKKEIGSGFSELVVAGDKIYTMVGEKIDSINGWEYLVCLDLPTGEEIWKTKIDDIFIDVDDWGDGPRSTPAVDDENIYCFSASGKLASVSRADGKKRWIIDFVERYGSTRPRWGYSTSPLLVDDMVLMEVGGEGSRGFAAFSKHDGALIWSSSTVASAYNSPIAANIEGSQHIIFASASKLYSFSPAGDSLWTFDMPIRSPMAAPLFIPPNKIFASAANDAGSFILEVVNNTPDQVMTSNQMRNDWSSSCYKDGFIYGFNVATLQCINAETGERQWLKRGFGKGSLIMVGDRLFVLSDQGSLTMVEATPDRYIEIGTFDALEGRSWTAPSYSDGKLFVRNHTHMACFELIPDKTSMMIRTER